MSPEEFKNKMSKIYGNSFTQKYDVEQAHLEADNLMCFLLRKLGYEAGVEIFEQAVQWYA